MIVAPGQGAQTPGFLQPWLEDATFAARFGWLSTVAGLDLAHYGTEADAETIRDTRIAQRNRKHPTIALTDLPRRKRTTIIDEFIAGR